MRCDLRGARGRLLAGYQEAAALSDWHLTGSVADDTFALVATVARAHSVWARYAPQELELELPEGGGVWRWTVDRPPGAAAGSALALSLVGLPRMGRS